MVIPDGGMLFSSMIYQVDIVVERKFGIALARMTDDAGILGNGCIIRFFWCFNMLVG
jgi:hypothetical protein